MRLFQAERPGYAYEQGGKKRPLVRASAAPVGERTRLAVAAVEGPGTDSDNSSGGQRSQANNDDEADIEDILAAPVER